jgi:DnaA-homolog protein
MSEQLPLGLRWQAEFDLDNFVFATPGERQMLLSALSQPGGARILITGPPGCGKSYLLRALCKHLQGDYLHAGALPATRENAAAGLRALDDLPLICGNLAAEDWAFADFNRATDARAHWLASSTEIPERLPFALPDLRSRAAGCLQIRLPILQDDAARTAALRAHAAAIGLALEDAVLSYLQTHVSRDLSTLVAWLKRLDFISLARKRKPSVALIRQLLREAPP